MSLLFFITVTMFITDIVRINNIEAEVVKIHNIQTKQNIISPEVQVYLSTVKYSKEYNVPTKYALRMLYHESTYRGPIDKDYNANLISNQNALGAAQVMLSTANSMSDSVLTYDQVLYDIDLNIKVSMKYLSTLYAKYHRWDIAFGVYNTGHKVVNDYAKSITK